MLLYVVQPKMVPENDPYKLELKSAVTQDDYVLATIDAWSIPNQFVLKRVPNDNSTTANLIDPKVNL